MALVHLIRICRTVDAKALTHQVGFFIKKEGIREEHVWEALADQISESKLRDVQSRLWALAVETDEDRDELARAEQDFALSSPEEATLLMRALFRKHQYNPDRRPLEAFADRIRSVWTDERDVQRLLDAADELMYIDRYSPRWDAILDSTPSIPAPPPSCVFAPRAAISLLGYTDNEIYNYLYRGWAHCEVCEESALSGLHPDRRETIEGAVNLARLDDERAAEELAGY